MEILASVFGWFGNGGTLASILGGLTLIISGATAIAVITPTPADDNILAKIRGIISLLSGNIGNNK